ncbi:hydantoinase B/oxoprolinase family protein [Streptosporangium sp. NBC_01810]|uniref:hydantoinase B/oxoprolinase family protein n=1 Tax=Streptosporangium sp. NBC_01810 TaxID=2975951 RepID=UPI002DDB952C|nr:hydantoinase B/oxoprolinase family protein [Streptosporangium sp. NBC_01810]WSA27904.1 hydantoinase B/oxoprolinase family protein [Streptosporangium sp. NBC_01810]
MKTTLGPIELEVITGTIRSAEVEIEAAVERAARSPMIRDQHDYRVGLYDAKGRKLTGRSYGSLVEPVFEFFGDDINPGDVFFWNDPYNSSGSCGHVPDLCTTVPIFHEDRLLGFAQVFGHHDDVGGCVPGSLPVQVRDQWGEGLVVPPAKLYDRGVLNETAFRIIERNSRLPEHLRGDIDSEIGACQLGSRRLIELAERYGVETLESAFDSIIDNCAETIRRELLPKIADGVYTFEDYIESDGFTRKLFAMRITMTKTAEKITLDFTGTDPEAEGPINWAIDYCEGRFVRKWLGPVLRCLADSPERAAEIDINEGILDVLDVRFPEKGTLVTPHFGRPTGLRFFILIRSLGIFAGVLAKATGGKMPADHETIRIWGMHSRESDGKLSLFREVLGGGGPGRPWADGSDVVHIVPNSRNLPAEFSEQRYPVLVESLALQTDSAGAGKRRGGFGYDKRVRALRDCFLLSNADRSELAPYGVNGGVAGQPYGVSIESDGGGPRSLPGMVDDVPVRAGDLVRLWTTGGGGWGDPLDRETELVHYDVLCGLVTPEAAESEYGVVVTGTGNDLVVDADATERLRDERRRGRDTLGMFDRGEHFRKVQSAGGLVWPEGWSDPDDWPAVTG